ncbi:hypothetical protein JOC55_005575 [Paenibacillus sacheonensis]|nr:hypothetical protein [Paenibacillus sacheonensis]
MRKVVAVCVSLVLVCGMVFLYAIQKQYFSSKRTFNDIAPGEVVQIEYLDGGNGLHYATANKTDTCLERL